MEDEDPDRVESDDAPATPPAETGERCPECGGSGERDGRECPACEGTGHVMRGLGGG
jgi:DnaJ-class molecular chaperone